MLYRHCYLYRLWRDEQDRIDIATRYTSTFQNSFFGNEAQTAEWRSAQRNILKLKELAERRSARIGLVIFPVLAGLTGDYPFREICDEIESFALHNGIPVHNLLPAFEGKRAPELWVSALDQHPNELGHAIAAESMRPFLGDLLDKAAGGEIYALGGGPE